MGSAARNPDLKRFVALRGLRIVPALATEITISAIFLGSLLTTFPPTKYYSDPLFIRYFGSLIGRISVILPGVFEYNPAPNTVNISLWTIGPELLCYVYMSCILLFRAQGSKLSMLLVTAFLILCSMAADSVFGNFMIDGVLNQRLLVICFCIGNAIYAWRYSLPSHPLVFFICLLVGMAAIRFQFFVYVAMFCFTYCIVYLGMTKIFLPKFFSRGDYSYGIYLYAFPIQQTVSYLLPDHRHWYVNILIALPITYCAAILSWNFVERPALSLRSRLPKGQVLGSIQLFPTFVGFACLLSYAVILSSWSGIVNWTEMGLKTLYAVPVAIVVAALLSAIIVIVQRRDQLLRRQSI